MKTLRRKNCNFMGISQTRKMVLWFLTDEFLRTSELTDTHRSGFGILTKSTHIKLIILRGLRQKGKKINQINEMRNDRINKWIDFIIF